MLLLRFLDLAIFYRDNEADIRPRWLYSTATASLISSPTFHRSRRAAYREYLWIKSALSRLISGLRFRQNRQVGQVYPTSRGQISSGRIYVPRKNEKNPRDSISRESPTPYLPSISPFPAHLSKKSRKYTCKNICSILLICICTYNLYPLLRSISNER